MCAYAYAYVCVCACVCVCVCVCVKEDSLLQYLSRIACIRVCGRDGGRVGGGGGGGGTPIALLTTHPFFH